MITFHQVEAEKPKVKLGNYQYPFRHVLLITVTKFDAIVSCVDRDNAIIHIQTCDLMSTVSAKS